METSETPWAQCRLVNIRLCCKKPPFLNGSFSSLTFQLIEMSLVRYVGGTNAGCKKNFYKCHKESEGADVTMFCSFYGFISIYFFLMTLHRARIDSHISHISFSLIRILCSMLWQWFELEDTSNPQWPHCLLLEFKTEAGPSSPPCGDMGPLHRQYLCPLTV